MAQGIALAIGLNSVDPAHYGGWSGDLNACEADADDMGAVAKSRGFSIQKLLTKGATRSKVISAIKKAAAKLKTGDMFLLSYSGHGGQLPDLNDDEPDGQDETWCLYDGEIIDDELNRLYGMFAKGVRILVFSDSCHSGTVVKMAYYSNERGAPPIPSENGSLRYRFMPKDVALRTYRENKSFYDKLLTQNTKKPGVVQASIMLISGCQDNQLSADGTFNGLFTGHMLSVWKNGMFNGNYRSFHQAIVRRMPPDQTPNLFFDGVPNSSFENQSPFTI
jgi:hypothetical protein